MPCFKVTAKKPLGLLLAIVIISQLVFVSSFLVNLITVLAQEESTPPAGETSSPAETTPPPADTTLTETPAPTEPTTETTPETTPEPTVPALPTETASTTGETAATDSASSTDSATGTINLEFTNGSETGTAQTLILGTGGGNSTGNNDGSSQTGLIADTSSGNMPVILAQWAMNNATTTDGQYMGGDDASSTGAQFLPSGQLSVSKTLTICALAADRDGVANLNGVYASIFYPEAIALPANRTATSGCGRIYNEEFSLQPLSQEQGIELFCNQIKNSNNNLPSFNIEESFDSICATDKELETLVGRVYCAEKSLAYDDPAGDYKVQVYAQDQGGNSSPILDNTFKYLELTAFAVDFNNVNYGNVQLNDPKVISGNLDWETPIAANPATIRNVGNTKMQLVVYQNDFGLGKTDNAWNIRYQARIGTSSDLVSYAPEQATVLSQAIDLAEIKSLDFGIEVYNFPTDNTSAYAGQMTLTADKADYATCP